RVRDRRAGQRQIARPRRRRGGRRRCRGTNGGAVGPERPEVRRRQAGAQGDLHPRQADQSGRMSLAAQGLRLTVIGAALALCACGFQLQGRTKLPAPLSTTYVQAEDEQSDFVVNLRKALIASGARLTARSSEAKSTVDILEDRVTERVLSVSASNIPREYELTYTVRFAVRADGNDLLPPQEVAVTRDYSFDERALLAKEHEEAILREALARDLVGIVMRRLGSL